MCNVYNKKIGCVKKIQKYKIVQYIYLYLLNFDIVGLPAGNDVAPPRNEVWEAKAHNSGVDTGVTAINYDDVSQFYIWGISFSFIITKKMKKKT